MRKLFGSLLTMLVLAVPAGAQTTTFIDFREYARPSNTEFDAAIGAPLTSGGLDFYNSTGYDASARNVLATWGFADPLSAPNRPSNIGTSNTLFATLPGNEVRIVASGSDVVFGNYAPFDLRSFDVAHVYSSLNSPVPLSPIDFIVFGFGPSGSFFQEFLIPLPPADQNGVRTPFLNTLALTDPGFRNAYGVVFYNSTCCDASGNLVGGSGVSVQFTNLDVTVSPEPGSLALLGTGLFGVAGVTLRRRRKSVLAA